MTSAPGRTLATGSVLAVTVVCGVLVILWPLASTAAQAAAFLALGPISGLGRIVLISAGLALGATLVGTVLAVAAAFTTRTLPRRPRILLDLTIGGLLLVPPYTVAAAVLSLGGRSGWLSGILPDVYGVPGMLVAMIVAHCPIPYITARLAWRGIDLRLVEMARVHGAGMRRIGEQILLPPLRRPLLVASGLMLVTTLSDPSISAVLRGRVPTLAHTAYLEVIAWGDTGVAAVIACLLAAPILPLLVLAVRDGTDRRLVDRWFGAGSSPVLPLPRSGLVGTARILTAVLVLVVLLLMGTAVVITLLHLPNALSASGPRVIASTVRHALLAVLVSIPVGLGTAWIAQRVGRTLSRGIDGAQTVLLLLPGTTVGIAFFLAYRSSVQTPLGEIPPLVGGASLASGSVAIVAVLAATAVPMVHLAARAARWQLPRGLAEAVRVLGATPQQVTSRLVLPQAAAVIAVAAAVVGTRGMVSVVPVVFVSAPEAPMVATTAIDALDRAGIEQAFLLSTTVAVLTGVAVATVFLASRRLGPVGGRGRR